MSKKSKHQEYLAELNASVPTSANGKKKSTWSRSAYDGVARSLINDVDHKVEVVTVKDGKVSTADVYPAVEYRKDIAKVLKDFGVDSQEAQKMVDGTYQFGKVEGLYPVVSESITDTLAAGKKFNFLPKKDMVSSLSMVDVEKTTKEYKAIGKNNDGKTTLVVTEAHKRLKSSGKAPSWLKSGKKK